MSDVRVPRGVPTGGQFAASGKAESGVTLDDDGLLPEPPKGDGFVKEWGPMSGVKCTVRTMRGVEVTGPIETRGNGNSIVVQRENGPWFSLPAERIHSIKVLETPAAVADTSRNDED